MQPCAAGVPPKSNAAHSARFAVGSVATSHRFSGGEGHIKFLWQCKIEVVLFISFHPCICSMYSYY